jgi:hypothetical protein
MARLVALLLAFIAAPILAADPPAGSWKLTLPTRQPITVLFALSQSEGKWVGDVIDVSPKLGKEPKFTEFAVNGEAIRFSLSLTAENVLSFDGLAAKDGKSLKGSLALGGGTLHTVDLLPSKLKSLADSFDLAKEGLTQSEDAEIVYENAKEVLRQAAAKKLPAEESRAILDRVAKLAAGQGRRWERYTTLKLAELIAPQEGYADVALAQARKAERLLSDDDDAATRMATLDVLVRTLLAAKKPEDAKPYQTQLTKLEAREYQDWAKANPPFKVEEYKGRKAKSDRVVLVEFFSGTEFEASAAIDLARDGILKMYKPSEVAVITYHLPIRSESSTGDSDPLTVMDGLDRLNLYADHLRRGKHGLVAGKPSVGIKPGETTAKNADILFEALRDRINEELELPAKAKLTLTVTPDKDGFTAKANVTDLEKPGENVNLRFALVEDRIRYPAGNGSKFHQMVVRALPGGAKGFPLKTATAEQTVTIKPEELRTAIAKYLGELAKDAEPLPVDRMTALKNLKLIAFIQNDTTGDVLTAAQADVK